MAVKKLHRQISQRLTARNRSEKRISLKILIVSDTHRHEENLEIVLNNEKNIDLMIHLGDVEGSEDYIRAIAGCPCYMVAGNNDYFSTLNNEIKTTIGDYNVLITHGHYYYVSLGYERIETEAVAQGMDIVMFGHTHRPIVEKKDNITLLNPGSISYPRQANGRPSYIIMTLDKDGEADYAIKYL